MLARTLSLVFVILVCLPGVVDAHSGAVKGRVVDPEGTPISGVVITATAPQTKEVVRTTSRSNGVYSIVIPELDWPWTLRFSLEGYEDGSVALPPDVTVGTRVDFTIHPEQRLKVSGIKEEPEAAVQARRRAEELHDKGVDSFKNGSLENAVELFRSAAAEDATFDKPLRALLVIATEAEDWATAGKIAEDLLLAAPEDVSFEHPEPVRDPRR